jgi:diguanylate cyclase (GGDEF)-like protein
VDDLPVFIAQKAAAADALYIGPAMFGRLARANVIPFSRRLLDTNGNFDGIILLAVVPDFLTSTYDESIFGKHGFLGVIGTDGIIRAAHTGQRVHMPSEPPFNLTPQFAPQGSGSVILDGDEWFADRRTRFVGWHAVKGYPLIALVGLDQQEAMAPYWASRAAAIRDAIWGTIALVILTFIAMAFSVRLAWRKHQLELTQATYRMATEGGNEGFYIVRPIRAPNGSIADFEIIDSNRRGAEMLRERRDELFGRKVSALFAGANPDRLMQWLRQALNNGRYEGDVQVSDRSPLAIRWVHLKIVRSDDDLAITLRDISDTKAHIDELERRSNEDALTGLPNRHWVQSYLPRAIEHAAKGGAMLALLFIDLDGFKKVNDSMGHAAGDELLKHAARRIKEAVRPHDYVVRLGGDEFLVIIEQITQKTDAAHVAERVVLAFKESFKLPQGGHSVGTSIGISTFPSDGTDSETLLHNADIAMYSVKTSGKGDYHFYDQKFYEALRARIEQESELREAIEHDQFVIYYQPRIDIKTGATSSMEALVRWAHPSKGLLEPLEFIPLAEETGLILGLGQLVINKVCAQIAQWMKTGQGVLPVSLNVSARQFNEADIAGILATCLDRHHIDANVVELEVTESSMMSHSTEVAHVLTAVRKMGVKLLVDDFGTGYSSLAQLQRLDFDMIKVDRAFTAELGVTERGKVFFKAIITMAHALGMRIVAEGVENETQIKILSALLCDEIQGFYISRPLPPSEKQPVLLTRSFPSSA